MVQSDRPKHAYQDYKGTLSQVVGTLGDEGPEEGVCVRKGTVEGPVLRTRLFCLL